ncbi:basement membrane proteoglycan-like [Planococcus citri]|uniref:basement membrane proteoglycan-like n=1 Tax=Planococcus citri TaxID=170843 RepID=UPI0031F9B9BA
MFKVQYFGNWCSLRCDMATFTATILVFYMQFCQIITTANEGSLVIFVETRFTCDNGTSIRGSQVCDKTVDCPDEEDELGCARTCEPREFKCSGKGTEACIPEYFRCNDEVDCYDGTDELRCTAEKWAKTKFVNQTETYEDETFEIDCFVYGEPISNIKWYKDDEPVPAKCTSTRDGKTSRLTCPKAERADQGFYTCKGFNPKKFTVHARPSGKTFRLIVKDSRYVPPPPLPSGYEDEPRPYS